MADVTMPQLGETVTEGTITRWFKEVGDQIAEDEVLFEVSTDKVDSEVPSPVSGYLAEIKAAEGDTVDVGAVIAVVTDDPPAEAGGTSDADAAEGPADQSGDDDTASGQSPSEEPPSNEPERAAAAANAPADAGGAAAPTGDDDRSPSSGGPLLSPLVRRLLDEHGLDPTQIQGTGVGGRITRTDVQQAASAVRSSERSAAPSTGSGAAPSAAPRRPAPPTPPTLARTPGGTTVEQLNNIRRRTGEHMADSRAISPHAMTAVEVDYEAVDRVRSAAKAAWAEEEGFSLTYLPFIARATVDALRAFPHINASVGDGALTLHHDVNLSVAVDLDYEGLLAPVVHGADQMRLRAIARSVHDLAARARARELSADDISGGTFTISNSGSFGTHMVIPIINQPQVAILSTDGISRKPVVVTAADGSEAIAIHSVGLLAMSWDHRAFDGAYAAAFLAKVKEILETRDWAAEL